MSNTPQQTIALFGATGGTGLSILKNLLLASHHVNVLVRTPSKLSTLSSQYPSTLHITTGNIRSLPDVKKTLISPSSKEGEVKTVDVVISCIGMLYKRKGLSFTVDDATLCYDGTAVIITALDSLESESGTQIPETSTLPHPQGPRIILLSTTGISDRGRDIPIAMIPFYHWVLHIAHDDKKNMEELMTKGEGSKRWARCTVVRPSLLVDGPVGGGKVRVSAETREGEVVTVGMEGKRKEGTVIGYTIRREDVGGWIVGECIEGDGERWEGRIVTLTY